VIHRNVLEGPGVVNLPLIHQQVHLHSRVVRTQAGLPNQTAPSAGGTAHSGPKRCALDRCQPQVQLRR
jgi:hypothetical protein